MRENPFQPPAASSRKKPADDAREKPVAPLGRMLAGLFDLLLLGISVVVALWIIGTFQEEPAKMRTGVIMTFVVYLGAQALPAYFRGATIGMAALSVQLDSHFASGMRGVLILAARNAGFMCFCFAFMALVLSPDFKDSTLSVVAGIVYLAGLIMLPALQLIGGLFFLSSARLSLQDRLTGTRIVSAVR